MINFLEKIMLRDKAYIFGSAGGGGGGGTSEEFSYTGKDQVYTVPKTGDYTIECFGAGSIDASGGYSKATFTLQEGDKLTLVAGQNGGSTSAVTYGYGGSSNYGSNCAGGGLSGVFTGDAQVTSSDASRALIIAGGAGSGGGVRGRGGAGGAETGEDGVNDGYGVVGSGGTQTGHGSSGNAGAAQFSGGNGSGTYGYGGGGGWRGGNGCIGDTSVHDDKGGGGGSCYIHTSGKNGIMTRGAGANVNENGKVIITSGGGGGEDEYEWLAYVEGTEHYLDTGILPGQSNYFRIDMRFMPLEDRIDRYFFCGGNISYAYNGMYFFNAGDSTGLLPHALSNEGQKYDATIAFGGGTILAKIANHPSMSGSYTGTLEHNSLLLFGDKNFQYSAHMRLYSLQLYEGDNDTITLSLKPCRRKKDGVLGMYDSVSGKFHPLVGKGYAPGDSTLAYYPFKTDQIDHTGNTSIGVTGTKSDIGYYFVLEARDNNFITNTSTAKTMSVRINYISQTGIVDDTASPDLRSAGYSFVNKGNRTYDKVFQGMNEWGSWFALSKYERQSGRNLLTITHDGSTLKFYVNGTLQDSTSTSLFSVDCNLGNRMTGYLSDLIIESKVWSEEEIANYFDSTKGNYGL